MSIEPLLDRIATAVAEVQPNLVEIRRDIHQHPELAFCEERTSEKIVGILDELGIEVERGIAVTGVVGTLKGGKPGPTFGLRADMDALPMPELSGLPFASVEPNVAHCCGHDCHVTMALGAAMALSQVAEDLPGTVKFVFQPGEEGYAGGKSMVEQGVLQAEPKIEAMMALHMAPTAPTGMILTRPGPIMAAADQICIEIFGQGGHGARPEETVDPIVVGSHVVQALQSVVSRQTSAEDSLVVSITKIESGTTYNVIPDTCTMYGTVRTVNEKLRAKMEDRIRAIVEGICETYGARGVLHYAYGYGVTTNHDSMTAYVSDIALDMMGPSRFREMRTPMMGAEDFSYFLNEVPGTFAFIGGAGDPPNRYPIHSSRVVIDEAVLEIGARFAASVATRYLHDRPLEQSRP